MTTWIIFGLCFAAGTAAAAFATKNDGGDAATGPFPFLVLPLVFVGPFLGVWQLIQH